MGLVRPSQPEREMSLVGVNFLLPVLKVRINTFKCCQLQIKMSHQKKNPCYIKFLILYWLESSNRRNEERWTWFHEQTFFLVINSRTSHHAYKTNATVILPALTSSSNLKSNKFAWEYTYIYIYIYRVFISQRKAPYMSKKVWGNISDINILTYVNQILSISKWLNYLV